MVKKHANFMLFCLKMPEKEVFLESTKLCASNYQNSVVNVLLQMLKLLWQDMKRVVVVCGAAQGKLLLITLNNKVLKHTNVVA